MNLDAFKQELVGASLQVATLDEAGCLLESDHSFLDLQAWIGKNLLDEWDLFLGLKETLLALEEGSDPFLLPMVEFHLDRQSYLLNLEVHRREGRLLLVFQDHREMWKLLREMQQERNNSVILLERIRQQEKQLRAANQRLKHANAELDRFAYVVSHDLKSPLRGIRNLAEWIQEGIAEGALDELEEHVALIHSRSVRMEQLIAAILEYSRATRSQLPASEVDVRELIQEVMDHLDPGKEVELVLPQTLPVLFTRRTWLFQVFSNLLSNAIKYGAQDLPDGVLPQVKIQVTELSGHFEFVVSDSGPGIPAGQEERIFDIFETLGQKNAYESTGIGLSIVKKLVEEAGGTVRVGTEMGPGGHFVFTWGKEGNE